MQTNFCVPILLGRWLVGWFVLVFPPSPPSRVRRHSKGSTINRYAKLLDHDTKYKKQRWENLLDCQWGNAIYLIAPVSVLFFSYEPIIRELDNVALDHF